MCGPHDAAAIFFSSHGETNAAISLAGTIPESIPVNLGHILSSRSQSSDFVSGVKSHQLYIMPVVERKEVNSAGTRHTRVFQL
jgi:hypothetical protein